MLLFKTSDGVTVPMDARAEEGGATTNSTLAKKKYFGQRENNEVVYF